MNQDAQTLYKLVILYFLNSTDFPLTNAQVSDYLLNHDFGDYFNIQSALSALEEDSLIQRNTRVHRSFLSITEEGKKILFLLDDQLSDSIREDIQKYIKENHYKLLTENSCIFDYKKNKDGSYFVTLSLTEHNETIFSLSMQVPNEENAKVFCEHWVEKNAFLYEMVMKSLMQD